MMTDREEEEEAALADFRIAPPRKVFYFDFKPELLLRRWPGTDLKRLRFIRMERWLKANYTPDKKFSREHPGYRLMVRNEHLDR